MVEFNIHLGHDKIVKHFKQTWASC